SVLDPVLRDAVLRPVHQLQQGDLLVVRDARILRGGNAGKRSRDAGVEFSLLRRHRILKNSVHERGAAEKAGAENIIGKEGPPEAIQMARKETIATRKRRESSKESKMPAAEEKEEAIAERKIVEVVRAKRILRAKWKMHEGYA